MSTAEFSGYVNPDKVPRIPKFAARMSWDNYPPPLERLLGMWKPLAQEKFHGMTTDGRRVEGLYSSQADGAPVAAAAQAAGVWIASLPAEVRSAVVLPMDPDVWRQWQNTPLLLRTPQVELEELTLEQRQLALEIVKASLSAKGHERTREVMANNQFLGQLNSMTDLMNEWAFTMTIFGEPHVEQPWGWQLFGHHLSVSCVFIGGRMVLSPIFMGAEPDHGHGEATRRIFKPHEDRALKLMRSLTDAERSRAVLYESMLTADQPPGRYHPDDGRCVGGAFQDNRVVPYEGIQASTLSQEAKRNLLSLVELFVDNLPDGPADARLREIERYLDQTHFAWIGAADDVNPFYFRIHSPVALFEFDHHSGIFLANEEPQRFHVHTIARSPNGGDYGGDLLRRHYASGGHDHAVPTGAGTSYSPVAASGVHSHDGGKTFHRHD